MLLEDIMLEFEFHLQTKTTRQELSKVIETTTKDLLPTYLLIKSHSYNK